MLSLWVGTLSLDVLAICCQDVAEFCWRTGPLAPACVFGNMLDAPRMPSAVMAELATLQADHRARLSSFLSTRALARAKASVGKEFLVAALRVIEQEPAIDAKTIVSQCFTPGHRMCQVLPDVGAEPGKLHGNISGVSCLPWSSMGSKAGWLAPESLAALQLFREAEICRYDWLIVECTPQLDVAGVRLALKSFTVMAAKISPEDTGEVQSRKRLFLVALRDGSMQWAAGREFTTRNFGSLFYRRRLLTSSSHFRAPEHVVEEFRNQMVLKRRLPSVDGRGRRWS